MVLARFFSGKELNEMVEMLKSGSEDPVIARKLEEYGPAYGGIYLDAYYDLYPEVYSKVKVDINREYAKKLLAAGVDEEIISYCSGIPIEEIKKIKKEL